MKEKEREQKECFYSMDRRKFLKGLGGMAGMAAAWSIAKPGGVSQAFAAEPKRGGRLVFDVRSSPMGFDPTYFEIQEEYDIASLCYNRLVRLTLDMKTVPELAERWQPNKKGDEWTFWLRKGIKFHHGRELEAKDVVNSFNHYFDAKGPAATELAPAKRAEIVDKYTVKIYLSTAYGEFPGTLGKPWAAVLPHDISFEKLKTTVTGTGPFKFKKIVPGEYTLVERNPDYWEKGFPYLDEVKQVVIPDFSTAMNALISGEIDLMHECEPQQYFSLKKMQGQGIVARRVRSTGYNPVIMDIRKKPFNDPRIRQAIKACVDRETFVDAVLNGLGTPANDHPIPPFYPYFADFPIKKQDYGRAKKLLADAGYPNGLKLKLHTSEVRAGMVPSAITIKDQCAPAGIDIDVKIEPSDAFWKQVWRKVPFCVSNWHGRPNMYSSTFPYFHSNGKWNTGHINNPTLDSCIDEAVGETDTNRAMRLYVAAESIVSELGGWVVPYTKDLVMAHLKKVQNWEVHSSKFRYFTKVWKKA